MPRQPKQLTKLLIKAGVDKVEDLTPEERLTYDHYRLVLSGEALTVDSLKEFCQNQIKVLLAKCDGVTPLTNLQQACLYVYTNFLKVIEAPEAERKALEIQLNQMIGS